MNIPSCTFPVVGVLVVIGLCVFSWWAVTHFTYDAVKAETDAKTKFDTATTAHATENVKIAGLKVTMDEDEKAHQDLITAGNTSVEDLAAAKLKAKTSKTAHNNKVIETNKLLKLKYLAESDLAKAKAYNIPPPVVSTP